jgi:hypothetical protein
MEYSSLIRAFSKTCNYELSSEIFERTQESCVWQPRCGPWQRRLHEALNYVCATAQSRLRTASETTERVWKASATDETHSALCGTASHIAILTFLTCPCITPWRLRIYLDTAWQWESGPPYSFAQVLCGPHRWHGRKHSCSHSFL